MPYHADIEYLLRFFASTYFGACNTIYTLRTVAECVQEDPTPEVGGEDTLEWTRYAHTTSEQQAILAAGALASLVEIKQSVTPDEWSGYLLEMPDVLRPLEDDMARYEALTALLAAGESLPEGDHPVFKFGVFRGTE